MTSVAGDKGKVFLFLSLQQTSILFLFLYTNYVIKKKTPLDTARLLINLFRPVGAREMKQRSQPHVRFEIKDR